MSQEIITKICLEKIAEKITTKGVQCESTMESVLRNLGCLSTEVIDFGDKKRFIPLNLKETILSMLYKDSYVHCTLTHSVDNTFWESESAVYLNKDDTHPSGEGRFAYTLKQYCEDNGISEEAGICSIGNWVRGLAKTRAIQSALPFLNLYCDEDIPKNETGQPQCPLPIPKSPEEKKQEQIQKNNENNQQTKPDTSAPDNDTEIENKMNSVTSTPETQEENSLTSSSDTTQQKNTSTEPSDSDMKNSMTLEEAFEVVADVGTCKGHTLREIYEKQPRNIVWLYGKGNSVHKEALLLIINSDPDLKAYIQ